MNNRLGQRWLSIALTIGISILTARSVSACPFCSAVKQSLRQEIATQDAVCIGVLAPFTGDGQSIDGNGVFNVVKVIKGDSLLAVGDSINVPYFGSKKSDRRFLLMGVDPAQLLWSSPLPISTAAEEYLEKLDSLSPNPIARLEFFTNYLEHEDELLADDAYLEFALAPYDQIQLLKPTLDREQLIEWIQDNNLSADRKRLYLTLLGICGETSDSEMLAEMLMSDDEETKSGLDAMIACYLTLKGVDGLPLVVDQFLANKDSTYTDTYSAIMALRFHGTEGNVIERKHIVKSMHAMLERPQLADLVIPDLARWEDWSQIERMKQLFIDATDDNSWVRVPVVNYLRACPKEEAQTAIVELEKIDPKAVKRAKAFFAIPRAKPENSESSQLIPNSKSQFAVQRPADSDNNWIAGARYAAANSDHLHQFGLTGTTPFLADLEITKQTNRLHVFCVLALFCSTLAIMVWLSVTSGGRQNALAPIKARDPRSQD